MKLKQLFCRHKKLTAVGIYEKTRENPYITSTARNVYVVCKCNRCEKEIEYSGNELDLLRHEFRKDINVSKLVHHELWGKWW